MNANAVVDSVVVKSVSSQFQRWFPPSSSPAVRSIPIQADSGVIDGVTECFLATSDRQLKGAGDHDMCARQNSESPFRRKNRAAHGCLRLTVRDRARAIVMFTVMMIVLAIAHPAREFH